MPNKKFAEIYKISFWKCRRERVKVGFEEKVRGRNGIEDEEESYGDGEDFVVQWDVVSNYDSFPHVLKWIILRCSRVFFLFFRAGIWS